MSNTLRGDSSVDFMPTKRFTSVCSNDFWAWLGRKRMLFIYIPTYQITSITRTFSGGSIYVQIGQYTINIKTKREKRNTNRSYRKKNTDKTEALRNDHGICVMALRWENWLKRNKRNMQKSSMLPTFVCSPLKSQKIFFAAKPYVTCWCFSGPKTASGHNSRRKNEQKQSFEPGVRRQTKSWVNSCKKRSV